MENVNTYNNLKIKEEQVIISMTSFPAAIGFAIQAIKSLLKGSVLPDKLVLYLTLSMFGVKGVPEELSELEETNPIFEIHNHEQDLRSYRKLIPALSEYPNAIIVTVDDDVKYGKHMLRDLLKWHKRMPETIIAHRVKRIDIDAPYKRWKKYRWYNFLHRRLRPSLLNLQTGVGGTLYPPHILKEEMMDVDQFKKFAPTVDDIWFWAAAVANNVPIMPVPFGNNKLKDLGKPKSVSLKTTNFKSGKDVNYSAFLQILKEYPKILKNIGVQNVIVTSDIDLVYLWVDGNDPFWKEKYNICKDKTDSEEESHCSGRYANYDEIKYSLRSIEKYAPWIRKIFIVTDSQVPKWLDTSNPKIKIVDHKEIMPADALPCFNSTIIEHHLHKIPGLSEKFLYANDDMLLNRPVVPSDFFASDGLPIIRMNWHLFRKQNICFKSKILNKKLPNYKDTLHKTALLVEKRYGKYISSRTHHNIDAQLISIYERVNQVFKNEIKASLKNHFRSSSDIQRNIYAYVALMEKRGHLRYVGQRTSFRFFIDNSKKYKKFKKYNPTFFCMNDSEFAMDSDRQRAADFLEKRFPEKSEFEK